MCVLIRPAAHEDRSMLFAMPYASMMPYSHMMMETGAKRYRNTADAIRIASPFSIFPRYIWPIPGMIDRITASATDTSFPTGSGAEYAGSGPGAGGALTPLFRRNPHSKQNASFASTFAPQFGQYTASPPDHSRASPRSFVNMSFWSSVMMSGGIRRMVFP